MARDARKKIGDRQPIPRRPLLMEALSGLIQAAAKQIEPSILRATVRSVGAQLGRQAVSEYRQRRHPAGRLDGYTWAECLKEIGGQFGWTIRVVVESDGVIRVDVLGCEAVDPDEPEAHMWELGAALFGGAVTEQAQREQD